VKSTLSWISILLLVQAFSQSRYAETVFTSDARYDGEITRQNEKELAIKNKNSPEVVIPREQITAIYDNDGNVTWSHPSIVKNDQTPEKETKLELPSTEATGPYRGWHVGVAGAFGVIWPSGIFSSFPLGTTPDYRVAYEVGARGAWYYSNQNALTFGLGYARRNVPISGIIEGGNANNGYWPMDYLDARVGFRSHAGIFFFEPGIVTAINLTNAPLTVETASRTLTNSTYRTPAYVAFYISVGANFPVTKQIFAFAAARVEHGVTPAVSGDAPTATDVNGKILSTAPINLIMFSASLELGVLYNGLFQ